MKAPNINTKVKHSESNNAWNVIGTTMGRKYKIARVPYVVIIGSKPLTKRNKTEAKEHADYISFCFNNPISK